VALQGLKPAVVAVEYVGAEAPIPYFEIEFGGHKFAACLGELERVDGGPQTGMSVLLARLGKFLRVC